ncbi:MAG: GNAT family N-acetyltransferase [Melioribacteraceae bacterium]|nr:GNAT family N-acetyltransferase [Melioribacteraceae bacterium]MCF8354991.1 GNAT family N-acetyltransferase [Melioribacteraceae bacterium]MCF8394316.1 GNAT family N-acetyltransferase [Melioribacteraceae bacterium]MCF8419995.1 GNAT family N-acetyltransferase [Melioribacteraceae bacterium]
MGIKNLDQFQKKITLRNIQPEDYEQIKSLQLKCFPGMLPWDEQQIKSHIKIFPEGQFCIVYRGKIIASSSSLILDFEMYDDIHNFAEITGRGYLSTHNPNGDTLYGIEIMVHPNYRGMKLARRLYDARKKLAREMNLKNIIVGGRIPGFRKYKDKLTAEQYIEKVENKSVYDPVLTSQLANGFIVKRILPDYLVVDKESSGYAVLMEWTNAHYEPHPHTRYHASRPVRICCVQYGMRKVKNFDEFANQCEYFVDVASGYKSDFILFPEIITTQLLSFIENKRPGIAARELAGFTSQYLEMFSNLAVRYNINIVGGSHFIEEDDILYNVSFLFQRNGKIDKQYKLHITPNERKWWGVQPGDAVSVFDTDVGKVAIQICYDIEFPELSRIAVEKGAQIIFVPFCTDERKGYLRVRYCSQARCIENQIYVAIAGNIGNLPQVENMDIQYAQSGIFTPSDFAFSRDGVAAECTPNVETVVIHDVDLELLNRHRITGTTLNWNDRRTDLYEIRVLNGGKSKGKI